MPTPAALVNLVLATRNPGKVKELQALLRGLPLSLQPASEIEGAPEVEEDRPTLEGNARKKADALHRHTGQPALADDTGLEVDALGGRPGVHSARFSGPQADDAANRAALLEALSEAEDRRARFRTVVALADEAGVRCVEGLCEGRILRAERGAGGFGYDALFVPEGQDRTFAEMEAGEKNAVSHRSRALKQMRAVLKERYGTR